MPVYDIYQITRNRLRYSVDADSPAHAMAMLENGDCILKDDETLDVHSESICDRATGETLDPIADRRHEVTAYPIGWRYAPQPRPTTPGAIPDGRSNVRMIGPNQRRWMMSDTAKKTADDLVLCQEFDGWSFHAPGSTDEQIADGTAPYITCGGGKATQADREAAFAKWLDAQ